MQVRVAAFVDAGCRFGLKHSPRPETALVAARCEHLALVMPPRLAPTCLCVLPALAANASCRLHTHLHIARHAHNGYLQI